MSIRLHDRCDRLVVLSKVGMALRWSSAPTSDTGVRIRLCFSSSCLYVVCAMMFIAPVVLEAFQAGEVFRQSAQ
jgi:hypothetical protein